MRKLSLDTVLIIGSGLSLGALGAALALWGNPANSGICVSCFVENLSGSLGLHSNLRMAYLRPELVGFVAGAFLTALLGREMRPRSGSYPMLAFVLGVFLIVGSSVFMGCPIKMMLRLGAGDMTAVAGILGLAGGVWVGIRYYRAGLDLGRPGKGQVPTRASWCHCFFSCSWGCQLEVFSCPAPPALRPRGLLSPSPWVLVF